MKKNNYKLDLFGVLKKISTKEIDFFDELTKQEQDEFAPSVILSWLSGTRDAMQLFLLNEVANPYIFSLYKHKQLLAKLLPIATSGVSHRYQWFKQKPIRNRELITIIQEYYNCSACDASGILSLLDKQDIIDIAAELGMQADELKKVTKQANEHFG